MQRNINKEIRNYEEDVFMGLSLRQLLCSIAAVGVAVGVYYGLRNMLGQETVSWVCIVAAMPVAAAGFFQYDGMNFEKFMMAVIRSEIIGSGVRIWKSENQFYVRKMTKKKLKKHKKEGKRLESE